MAIEQKRERERQRERERDRPPPQQQQQGLRVSSVWMNMVDESVLFAYIDP